MKASEAIKAIQALIDEHGDLPVMVEGFDRDGGLGPEHADRIEVTETHHYTGDGTVSRAILVGDRDWLTLNPYPRR